ncbi:hypothetical protein UlMin_039854 [Ulmus minor]
MIRLGKLMRCCCSVRGVHAKSTHHEVRKQNPHTDLYLYKSKGQHILTNPRILDSIVAKSAIKHTDTVLEIGPGTGNLTLKLLQVAARVVAVEIDTRMVDILNKRVSERGLQETLTVIRKDALKTEFPRFDLVVANIPYGISSPLIAKLLYAANPFRSATLLLQKEFATRLLANPGDSEYNRLAVNVKLVADVDYVMDVSKRDFLPPPKVDSSLLIIRPKAQLPNVNLDEWLAFTKTCFGKKNKTLGATFKQKKKLMELLSLSDEQLIEEEGRSPILFRDKMISVLKSSGFDDKRPSKLCNEELLRLLGLFNQVGIYFHDKSKSNEQATGALCFDDNTCMD